jgi:hypothetical protein
MPIVPKSFELIFEVCVHNPYAAPIRPHPVPSQYAVLVLGKPPQRHEQKPLLGPTGFGGNGKHLGG